MYQACHIIVMYGLLEVLIVCLSCVSLKEDSARLEKELAYKDEKLKRCG